MVRYQWKMMSLAHVCRALAVTLEAEVEVVQPQENRMEALLLAPILLLSQADPHLQHPRTYLTVCPRGKG